MSSASHTRSDPRQRLIDLVKCLRAGSISVETFCKDFETTYNLSVDKSSLNRVESAAFAALFEVVIWYSPFPEERKRIPNYVGEEEVLEAASDADRLLSTAAE